MECFDRDVNRMVCGMGWSRMVGLGGEGGVKSGLRRLCVVCATTETVVNATTSSKSTPPVSHG